MQHVGGWWEQIVLHLSVLPGWNFKWRLLQIVLFCCAMTVTLDLSRSTLQSATHISWSIIDSVGQTNSGHVWMELESSV